MEGVNPDTVWTWNAVGRRAGAAALDPDAPEATRGFLLNHLITELLPEREGGYRFSNSDPITGQAAWYDLRVSIEKAAPDEAGETSPRSSRCTRRCSLDARPRHDQRCRRRTDKKLGLVIDLDTCVGCQACATSCKEWNAGGYSAPLTDQDAHGGDPHGAWLNRVHSYEVGDGAQSRTVHFPRSCLHCETPACVTVCPTGASYKRASDGIVLVNPDTCIGCKLCSWACPYGAREYDYDDGVMKKCTLCVDRIYNETFAPEDRIPACVRACPTGARHFGDLGDPDERGVAAREGARGLRPAAGDGLQAGEQVSAAAAAPRPDAPRRRRAPPSNPRRIPARSPTGSSPGPTRPWRAEPRTMHPAYSVIVFTTASGAGYGLLIWLAVAVAFDLVPRDPVLGFFGLGVALALITIGLLDLDACISAGRSAPGARCRNGDRRGCRAKASPRSSPICRRARSGSAGCSASSCRARSPSARALSVPCALVTLWCTGMIYASLPTIRAWHQPLVAPVYVVLALATGGVLLTLLLVVFGYDARWAAGASALALVLGCDPQAALLVRDRHARRKPTPPKPRPASATSARCGRSIRRTPSRIS